MADASPSLSGRALYVTLASSAAVGEVRQLGDGRAGYLRDRTAGTSGQRKSFAVDTDVVVVTKTAGVGTTRPTPPPTRRFPTGTSTWAAPTGTRHRPTRRWRSC
jgi:hypothetical protein